MEVKAGVLFSLPLIISVLIMSGCTTDDGAAKPLITDFDSCVAAGNPVMESYPRQCRVGNRVFVENITLTMEEALSIAESSPCMDEGGLTGDYFYNPGTRTWWFDMDTDMPGCAPACVVDEISGSAEINYRCTGLLE